MTLGGANIENYDYILKNLVYVRLTIVNTVKIDKPIYSIIVDYIKNNDKIERLCNSYDDLGIALENYYMFVRYLKKEKVC